MPRVIAPVDLDHIAIQIYGPRNQLLGHCKVPAADLPDFMLTVSRTQAVNPSHSPASLIRWLFRLGWKQVKRHVASRHIPASTME